MLTRHSHPRVLTIELIQGCEVLKNDLSLRRSQEWRSELIGCDIRIDITKNPWCALRCATDHYSFCAGEIKYCACALRRIDIAIGNQRHRDVRARLPDGVVF